VKIIQVKVFQCAAAARNTRVKRLGVGNAPRVRTSKED
jgi:hypothetical protein